MKRFISMLLVVCILTSTAFAEEESKGFFGSVGDWFGQATKDASEWASDAWDDTTDWASQAWDDTTDWASQAWNDTSDWASHAWDDASAWAVQAWADVSAWTVQAWDDSSKWVAHAWANSSEWTATNWDHFIVWVNTVASGDPYAWIKNVVLDNGILAYDAYVDVHISRQSTSQKLERLNPFFMIQLRVV